MGVCAGLADYSGCNAGLIRLLAIIALLWFNVLALVVYFALGFLLPTKTETSYDWDTDEIYRGSVSRSASNAFCGLRHRLREPDMKWRQARGYGTSNRYDLDRQFRDLEH